MTKKAAYPYCPSCSSSQNYEKAKGNQLGLYCKSCNKWIKWLPKSKSKNPYQKLLAELFEYMRIKIKREANPEFSLRDNIRMMFDNGFEIPDRKTGDIHKLMISDRVGVLCGSSERDCGNTNWERVNCKHCLDLREDL